MESLGMNCFNNLYEGKKVFLTGHTGFKGSWLNLWLNKLGANVCGYSLEPATDPSHYTITEPDVDSVFADIRNYEKLQSEISRCRPDIVIHMAAQPLVRRSYSEPLLTYETNVMGTANILEATRHTDSVRAVLIITTDKCYDNKEWVWGYRENDSMGGYDPYSSSKGAAELVTAAYRNSFYNLEEYGKKHEVLVASARAGNVIGGGDWSTDRLVPDIMKATQKGEVVEIRSPNATRPWEHVLEPLSGYLMLGEKLLNGEKKFAEAWNFGPGDDGVVTVQGVLDRMCHHWDKIKYRVSDQNVTLHEANLLKLDCSKAHSILGWKNVWSMDETFTRTVEWYRQYYEKQEILTDAQIDEYIEDAQKNKAKWSL